VVTWPAVSLAQDRESMPAEPAVLTTMLRHQENCKFVDFNYSTPVWRQFSEKSLRIGLVPISNLDDLERPICTPLQKMSFSEPTTKIWTKLDLYCQHEKCRSRSLTNFLATENSGIYSKAFLRELTSNRSWNRRTCSFLGAVSSYVSEIGWHYCTLQRHPVMDFCWHQ